MDRLYSLIAKKKSGSITPQEQLELSRLLADDDVASLSNTIDSLFQVPVTLQSVDNADVDMAVNKLIQRLEHQQRKGKLIELKRMTIRKIAVAAAILLLFIGGTYIGISYKNTAVNKAESIVQTKKGSKSNMTLPDGTKVWINADSKLTYDKNFGTSTREVVLTGEAYFDVIKDKERPFIVHTKVMDVKVLGTAFNVRAYESEINSQTTLVRGKVELTLKKYNGQKILMNPNEKVVVKNSYSNNGFAAPGKESKLSEVAFTKIDLNPVDSTVYETGWVNNKLIFRQEKFEDIIPVLERWYNVKIIVKNVPTGKGFSGTFENDSLEDVLQSLMLSAGINYKIEKGNVIIY